MNTFISTWNPARWSWSDDDRRAAAKIIELGQLAPSDWSFGRRRHGVRPGVDRLYLLKLGDGTRGIVASGWIESEPYEADHWDGTPGKTAIYVDVAWDCVLDPDEDPLSQSTLTAQVPDVDWSPQGGGVQLPRAAAAIFARLWVEHTGVAPYRPRGGPRDGKRILCAVALSKITLKSC